MNRDKHTKLGTCMYGLGRLIPYLPLARIKQSKVIIFVLLWLLSFQIVVFFLLHGTSGKSKFSAMPAFLLRKQKTAQISNSVTVNVTPNTKSHKISMQNTRPPLHDTVGVVTLSSEKEAKPSQFSVIHSSSGNTLKDSGNIKYVLIIPHALQREEEQLGMQFLGPNDQQSVLHLGNILNGMPELDGASCLPSSLQEQARILHSDESAGNTVHSFSELFNSSWCRFAKRDWSVQIRNTGEIERVAFNSFPQNSNVTWNIPYNSPTVIQICNIVRSAFVLRKEKFMEINDWHPEFGKLGILDFFLRSNGVLKVAKVANCFMYDKSHRVDRGDREGLQDFPEYSSFGNEHGVLRIIQEDRIEWTTCIARGKVCKEKPYTPPTTLPRLGLPICCSVVLGKMLKDLVGAMMKLGVWHRIIYGTLLGGIRNNAIIPWTHDVDIGLYKNDYGNDTFYAELQKAVLNRYHVGKSFMGVPRMIPLIPAHIEANTAKFFNGSDDLQGDKFFSELILNSVKGLLPIQDYWRERGYLDFYSSPDIWWNGSSTVNINGDNYITIRDIDFELTNWYGESYKKPVIEGNSWYGLSDVGA